MEENDPINSGNQDMGALSEHQQFLNNLGLPVGRRYVSGPPLREPNIEEVRAYYEGDLSGDMQTEVEACILNFEEWDKLSQQVLNERAEIHRERQAIQTQVDDLADEDDA